MEESEKHITTDSAVLVGKAVSGAGLPGEALK